MHVVVIRFDEASYDMKGFSDPSLAYSCYNRFAPWVGLGGFHGMSIYEVLDATTPGDAINAVANGRADQAHLMKIKNRHKTCWVTLPDDADEQLRRYWGEYVDPSALK